MIADICRVLWFLFFSFLCKKKYAVQHTVQHTHTLYILTSDLKFWNNFIKYKASSKTVKFCYSVCVSILTYRIIISQYQHISTNDVGSHEWMKESCITHMPSKMPNEEKKIELWTTCSFRKQHTRYYSCQIKCRQENEWIMMITAPCNSTDWNLQNNMSYHYHHYHHHYHRLYHHRRHYLLPPAVVVNSEVILSFLPSYLPTSSSSLSSYSRKYWRYYFLVWQ